MKLGTLKSESLDGKLVVVSKDNKFYFPADDIAPSLRVAIETWNVSKDKLKKISDDLNEGKIKGITVDQTKFHSPMPRSFQWADGSAFLHHVKLVRKSRNAPMPDKLYEVPLMYQGGSDGFLAPNDDIPQIDFVHGTDFEGEVGVITDFVPMGTTPDKALEKVILVVMINDVSLRGLIPEELANGFGFFHGKPASAFGPFAVTTDELGEAWKEGRVHLPLHVELNGNFFGKANGKEMHFHFGQLISHAAKTRDLAAGTIIGSGTISNENPEMGSSCLLEKRMIELIEEGASKTPFMKVGDRVRMFINDKNGISIFGEISQRVEKV